MAEHEHHHHHHDHDEECCCEECCGIEITEHEGALIGTLSGHVSAENCDAARDIVSGSMQQLALLINGCGGIIGHIKSIVSEEGRGYQISVTESDSMIRELGPNAFHVDLAVIVFAVGPEKLHDLMEQTVGTLILPEEDCCN